MQKRVAGTLIKPVEFEDFWGPFSKMAPKMIGKALPREGFRNAFPERRETLSTQRKTLFLKSQKRVAKTLIKPVEIEDFWDPFREMAPKMIQKALPREGSRNAFSKLRKPL